MPEQGALALPEPRRDKQIGVKLTEVELAEIQQAAAYAQMEVAPWCRAELLKAARGERSTRNVEVPQADLSVLHAAVEKMAKLQYAVLHELMAHTHHGDPTKDHEDGEIKRRAERRADAKMKATLAKLNLNGSGS